MSWTASVQFPTGAKDFSLFHSVQIGSGANTAYLMGTGAFPPGFKRPGRETDH
jgi:hypothetical protein